jgi:hypothetical protein
MVTSETVEELPQLNGASFRFIQDGNTVGTTSDTESLEVLFETQLPGEEPFFVLKTSGWSFDDYDDIMTILVSAKTAYECVRTNAEKIVITPIAKAPITRPASAEGTV